MQLSTKPWRSSTGITWVSPVEGRSCFIPRLYPAFAEPAHYGGNSRSELVPTGARGLIHLSQWGVGDHADHMRVAFADIEDSGFIFAEQCTRVGAMQMECPLVQQLIP